MVSSSRIRTAIRAGDLGEAKAMLVAALTPWTCGESAAVQRLERVLRIERSEILQVLPPNGEYTVDAAKDLPGPCRAPAASTTIR